MTKTVNDGMITSDEIACDMAQAVAWDAPLDVAREFLLRYLGYVPQVYAQMKNIPAEDALDS